MEVKLGACGLVIAFLCTFFGMTEIGLWVACYFECSDGKEIEFNYFAAIWTGVLAFAIGFMIMVLACVKFKSLGTFIIVLTFLLVPCEIICACIYAYRAFLAVPVTSALTDNVTVDYFGVIMYSAMAFCGLLLFITTIFWNCYYCCIATPLEDYEEEVKEDLDEEAARHQAIRSAQDRFINNPIVEDDFRSDYPRTLPLGQPRQNRYPENGQVRFPDNVRNGYPDTMASSHARNPRSPDKRSAGYERSAPIQNVYPYPPALNRESVPDNRNRRTPHEISMSSRHNMAPTSQSRTRTENGRGQVNRGYEPDEFGRPVDNSYQVRSYMYDGNQGVPYDQHQRQDGRYNQNERPPDYSGRAPNPNPAPDYSRRNLDENRRHVNRPKGAAVAQQIPNNAERRDGEGSHIYRPRPDNFRGKPPKPEYMQQQQQQQPQRGPSVQETYLGGEASQYSAFRDAGSVNYF